MGQVKKPFKKTKSVVFRQQDRDLYEQIKDNPNFSQLCRDALREKLEGRQRTGSRPPGDDADLLRDIERILRRVLAGLVLAQPDSEPDDEPDYQLETKLDAMF